MSPRMARKPSFPIRPPLRFVEATFDPSDRDPHEVDRLFGLLTEEELSEFRN